MMGLPILCRDYIQEADYRMTGSWSTVVRVEHIHAKMKRDILCHVLRIRFEELMTARLREVSKQLITIWWIENGWKLEQICAIRR